MFNSSNIKVSLIALLVISMTVLSCSSSKRSVKYSGKKLPARSSIGVIIDSPNNIKNVVLVKFLKKGYNVKGLNASDMYAMNEIFDIKDVKKLSYNAPGDAANSLVAMEKSYNNIFKLHFYNFEVNKAELLTELKSKWQVNYLILLDLKDWEQVSWGRIIDLNTFNIIWLENYPTKYGDDLETVVEHFISSMTGR